MLGASWEPAAIDSTAGRCSKMKNMDPDNTATNWPPMTLRGVDAMLFGKTKMVKAVEAMDTTIASLSMTV